MKYVDGPHRMAKEFDDICISSGSTPYRGISQQSGGQDDPSFEYQTVSFPQMTYLVGLSTK